jgi:hypothetical protein
LDQTTDVPLNEGDFSRTQIEPAGVILFAVIIMSHFPNLSQFLEVGENKK